MLDKGVDPNMPNATGKTALGAFAGVFRGNDRSLLDFSDLLLAHGANPMRGDKPLGTAISHAYSSFLVTSTLSAIARAEKAGKGLRDEDGGNVLHYLASVDPQLAGWQLDEDISAIQDGDEDLFFPPQMINARRQSDGSTPLDVLWRTGTREWLQGKQPQGWLMTSTLLTLGADPFMQDANGECVFQQMERLVCAEMVDRPPMAVWGPLCARWSDKSLSTSTLASNPSPPTPRF